MKIFLLLLLFPISIFAQDEFYRVPLKGKITSYTTTKVSGDSLKPTLTIIEKVTYDQKGRMLTSFSEAERGSQSNEVNVYNGNTLTNYKCRCKDIDAFVKSFIIRDNAELKRTMSGSGTGNEPTKFVKVTQLDKNGNAAVVSNYSENGYKGSETKSWFDAANRPVKTERYNFNGKLEEMILNEYNKAGKLLNETTTRTKEGEYKQVYTYDKDGNNTDLMAYADGRLLNHYKYAITDKGAYKEFTFTDVVKKASRIQKQVYYDAKGREIKLIMFDTDGQPDTRFEHTYDKNGNISTYSTYTKEGELNTKYEFTLDAKGNAVAATKRQLVRYHTNGKIEPKVTVSKYKREIVYGK